MNLKPGSAGQRRAAALVGFGLALGLYSLTLAPSVATLFDDSLEFQLVVFQPGIAHPTGYPLYTLLGWLFTRLPMGDVAFRVNLMSAVFGAVTVALVVLTGLGLGGPRPGRWQWLGAAVGAGCLALSPVFWSQTALAEVYTLNSVFVALILYLLTGLAGSDRPKDEAGLYRRLVWVALAFGLGLAHHRTVVLLLPAALLVAVTNLHRLSAESASSPPPPSQFGWKQHLTAWLKLGLALVLPLALYAYLPLRGQVGSLDGSYENTLSGFLRHVTASGYGSFLFDNPFGVERGAGFYLNLFLAQFGWVGMGLGLLGLAGLARRRVAGFSLLAFVTYFVFNLAYLVADIQVFFIPTFLIWAVWIGAGVACLLQGLAGRLSPGWVGLVGAGLVLAAGVQMGVIVSRNYPGIDHSSDWAVYDYGRDVMQLPLEPDAAIVGIQGEITLFRYFQATQGLRPDLTLIAADREPERWQVVEDLLDQGRAVYLTRDLPGAAQAWSLSAAGPLIRVRSHPQTQAPAVDVAVGAPVAPGMLLYGYDLDRPAGHQPVAPLRLTLVWQANGPAGGDWKVSARLLAEDGAMLAQADAVPVHFAYPTSAWRPGEFVTDVYDFFPPLDLAPGAFTPVLIVYDPAQGAAELGRISLAPVQLP